MCLNFARAEEIVYVCVCTCHLNRCRKHEVDAALVVEVDVPGRVAGPARADAGVEVEPLPDPSARHQGQHVHVDVVDAARRDDFSSLRPILQHKEIIILVNNIFISSRVLPVSARYDAYDPRNPKWPTQLKAVRI